MLVQQKMLMAYGEAQGSFIFNEILDCESAVGTVRVQYLTGNLERESRMRRDVRGGREGAPLSPGLGNRLGGGGEKKITSDGT